MIIHKTIYHKEDKYYFEVYGVDFKDLSTRVILRANNRVKCDLRLNTFISKTNIPKKVLKEFKKELAKELI